jgi:hypothetical protein
LPRINGASVVSLFLMMSGPTLMYYVGLRNYDFPRVVLCTTALASCVVYVWMRCCWLLQQLQIESTLKQILFPGLLAPGLLLTGAIAGNWVLGILFLAPVWPVMVVPHTVTCAVVGLPLGLMVYGGLSYVFAEDAHTSVSVPETPDAAAGPQCGFDN